MALACEVGAEHMDMEFVQFHPTGMVWPPGVQALFGGPRFSVRVAGLEMHPLDGILRAALLKNELGIGFCNITKCCTEVCPEEIRITDNAIIPLKRARRG